MTDQKLTKAQLLSEISLLRQKIEDLEQSYGGAQPSVTRKEASKETNKIRAEKYIKIDISQQKQAEEALRKSEEKYRFLTEKMVDMIWTLDINMQTTYVSPSILKVLGFTPEERMKQTLSEIMPQKSLQCVAEIIKLEMELDQKEGVDPNRSITLELEYYHKDGSTIWCENLMGIIRDQQGNPIGVHGVSREMTKRIKAEEALRESEEKHRILLEESPDPIFSFTPEGQYKYVNRAFAEGVGKSAQDIIGKKIWDVFPQEEADKRFAALSEVFQTGKEKVFEARVPRTEGDRYYVTTITPVKKSGGAVLSAICSSKDITKRKQVEEEILKEKLFSDAVLDSLPDVFYVLDEKAYYVRWNKNEEKVTGYTAEELSKLNALAVIAEKDRELVAGKIQEAFINGYASVEANLLSKNGEIIPYYLTGYRAIIEKNIYLLGMGINITERKKMEESLRSSEQLFSEIIEFLPDATLIIDGEGKVIAWNRAMEEMTAVKAEDMLGKGDHEYALPFIGKRKKMLIDFALNNEREKAVAYLNMQWKGDVLYGDALVPRLRGKKAYLSATASVLRDAKGGIVAAIECVRDVTEKRQSENELRQAEERYRSIFENAQEGIYRVAPEGRIIMANQAMARMLGYDSPEELIANITDITDIHHPIYVNPEDRSKIMGMIEKQGSVKNYDVRLCRKDGRIISVSATIQAVRDEKGQIIYYEGIDEDITERKESIERMRKSLGATVQAMAVTVETRDPYTAGHQKRVADLARSIATEMGLTKDQIDGIRMAGIIHDLGKISVPAEILSKPSKLTNIEFELIKTHVRCGYDILKDIDFPWSIARMVLEHHERMDGSGYPQGLTGDKLLPESRILSVADVVESMASHRPYRPALGVIAALAEINMNKGLLYDPEAVDACLRLFHEKNYVIN
jgi:PAS domain S-box-containing protein